MKLAAIDIGTVTCRLLIADVVGSSVNEICRHCAITNLGVGVDKTSYLQLDAIERVVSQIQEFVKLIDEESLKGSSSSHVRMPIVAFATSAARDAKNSSELTSRLGALGVKLSVISGKQEASLSFKGASSCFSGESLLVVDTGGGSTEVIFGKGGQEPSFSHSFNVGCRRITERFLFSDPPTPSELEQARAFVQKEMRPYFEECLSSFPSLDRIVAVAGTATSAVSIKEKMKQYNPELVHKACVSSEELRAVYEMLASKPLELRKQVVGLEPQRAGVIVAGMLILTVVLELSHMDSFTVSELDILHGILLEESTHYLL